MEKKTKIFLIDAFKDRHEMEEDIKSYIEIMKNNYPNAVITREFYKGSNSLVRVTEIKNKQHNIKQNNKEREIDDWYIRQRGER